MFSVRFRQPFAEKSLKQFLKQYYKLYYITAVVAQLVEHWIVAPEVAGPSPAFRPRPRWDTF